MTCGEVARAVDSFEAGSRLPDAPHRSHAQRLWHARALDLAGRGSDARRLCGELAREHGLSRALRSAAREGATDAYRAERLSSVAPDFIFGDVYAY